VLNMGILVSSRCDAECDFRYQHFVLKLNVNAVSR
jgi:hypothetical protein